MLNILDEEIYAERKGNWKIGDLHILFDKFILI